jgi:hypothetical protein
MAVQLVHQYLDFYAAADAHALKGRGVPCDLTAGAVLLKQLAPQSAVEPALSR